MGRIVPARITVVFVSSLLVTLVLFSVKFPVAKLVVEQVQRIEACQGSLVAAILRLQNKVMAILLHTMQMVKDRGKQRVPSPLISTTTDHESQHLHPELGHQHHHHRMKQLPPIKDFCAKLSSGCYRTAYSLLPEDSKKKRIFAPPCPSKVVVTSGGNQIFQLPESSSGDKEISSLPIESHMLVDEPFVGMVLEVAPSKDEESGLVRYELTEQVHDELGLKDVHALDYAYRPVIRKHRAAASDDQQSVAHHAPANIPPFDESITVMDARKDDNSRQDSLLDIIDLEVDKDFQSREDQEDKENQYEKMGERAFAGGSHGEVWRARRRCDIFPSRTGAKTKIDGTDNSEKPGLQTPCDDREKLIMKRLKLEQGHDLLEAGLREVYFGQLLDREDKSRSLFTTYVDHFFRRGSVSSLRGSSSEQSSTELWIVFTDSGPSLRSYLYTPVTSGSFVLYQHSEFWRRLRKGIRKRSTKRSSSLAVVSTPDDQVQQLPFSYPSLLHWARAQSQDRGRNNESASVNEISDEGRYLIREVLRQLLSSAAFLHDHDIVHRDIKPSNIMCKTENGLLAVPIPLHSIPIESVKCVLGDFSSAWDEVTAGTMYTNGPSANEQTDEYAPPEVLFGPEWIPFDEQNPYSYDSWSIGVVALEMLLGTPNVFSVDQRTTAILSNRLNKSGATTADIQKALYLAALSQFCIYIPTGTERTSWPWRHGDPLHKAAMVKPTCTMHDFHSALRARDPLGLGFDSSADQLLELIWALLAWNPSDRITPSQALNHPYFKQGRKAEDLQQTTTSSVKDTALMSQQFDSHLAEERSHPTIREFVCPKCKKRFDDYNSCHLHANSRRHAKFCSYDHSLLPPCLSSHSMLPAHPTSGYCDIQGRRPSIEDFHSIHLHPSHQFFGVFDGHHGNLASKFAASRLYGELSKRLADIDRDVRSHSDWKDEVTWEVTDSFRDLHESFLREMAATPGGVMAESGTTATFLYITAEAIIVANVGDSRAVLSVGVTRNAALPGGSSRPTALPLTVDHTPADPNERQRIVDLGGFVSSVGGIERVNGTLAVSRSIGDASLSPLLSRTPHIVAMSTEEVRTLCEQKDEAKFVPQREEAIENEGSDLPCFVVLASDGLWDVMSNQEAVDMVVEVLRHSTSGIKWEDGGAFQEAAQRLTDEAFVRGSTDNIGVCVVALT